VTVTGTTHADGPNGADQPALGSDPFAETVETDPFLEGLAALGRAPLSRAPDEVAAPVAIGEDRPEAATPLRRNRVPGALRIAEAEPLDPEELGWWGSLLSEADRRRMGALAQQVEGRQSYDRFGFSADVTARALPFFRALHKLYFRVGHTGFENVPRSGAAVIAANHGGLLPFDGAMIVTDVLLGSDPPRLPRAIVDRWVGSLPWLNVFYARVGQVIGTRENFADLLEDGQLVVVFPEGTAAIRKTIAQRYRLQHFHVGFIEQALLARAPVIPVAVIGSDDQAPILHDFQSLARRLGLPALPITPTFPWLGPLGLLPYPVSYHLVYGEPLRFHERFGPEDADDPRLVDFLARQVRREIQRLLDRHR
jgi:1-acyl-sn-glycerol-3-phosphate acyltransferase